MKKITIIFGGNVEPYEHIVRTILEEFDIQKLDKHEGFTIYASTINLIFEFVWCYGPTRDENYKRAIAFYLREYKQTLPPPADEVCKNIKKTDLVLFFGLCGAFKGQVNDVYLPTEFWEINFNARRITPKHITTVTPQNKIICDNLFIGKVKGKKSRQVTSNITLAPKLIEAEDPAHHLRKLAYKLFSFADTVDKESYEVVKALGGKFPIGLLVLASDVLDTKEFQMMLGKEHYDRKIFNKVCTNALKSVLVKLLK